MYLLEDYVIDKKDGIGCPNGEHAYGEGNSLHLTAPGSFCNLDSELIDGLWCTKGYTWQQVVDKLIENLLFDDGGCIIMNHPLRYSDFEEFFFHQIFIQHWMVNQAME